MKRRAKGTGSLRRVGEGRYRLQIEAQDGKALSRVFEARNDTEANKTAGQLAGQLLAEYAAARASDGAERAIRQGWTVRQYAVFYMREWAPLHLAATTRERRQGILNNQVLPLIGHKRMSEVTADDLAAMYARLGTAKPRKRNGAEIESAALSANTITTIHTAVRALFAFAYEIKRDIPENPAARKAARPRVTPIPRRYAALSIEQVERIVSAVAKNEERIAVPVMLAAYLGTRRGETVALRWEDVDFAAKTIRVRRSVSWTPSSGLQVKGTKTDKERTIPLDDHTLSELQRVRSEQRQARMKFGKGWRGAATPEQDHIASEADGKLMNPAVIGVALQRACKTLKLGAATLQQLRHSWVSQQIANGFDAVTIAAMSGHSPDVLLRVYAHAFDARKREAMDKMGEARRAARARLEAVAG